jgi:hypothetical protein
MVIFSKGRAVCMTVQQEKRRKWAQVVASAWSDEGFKRRLLAEPTVVLKEAGLEVPEGIQLKVVENTDRLAHLVLPPKPGAADLSEEHLVAAASGFAPTLNFLVDCGECGANCL